MIDLSSKYPLVSSQNLAALAQATIYMQIVANAGDCGLLNLPNNSGFGAGNYLYIASGEIRFNSAGAGCWSWPGLWSTGAHRLGLQFNFDGNVANVPMLYVDGATVAAQVVGAPLTSVAHTGGCLALGNGLYTNYAANGYVGEIAVCNQAHSAALMAQYTSPYIPKRALRFAPGCIHYWPLDELSDGATGVTTIDAHPSSDINTLWSYKTLATYWQSVLADDSNYIEATDTEENEDQTLGLTWDGGKPAGVELLGLIVYAKNAGFNLSDQDSFTIKIKKGSTWYSAPYLLTLSATTLRPMLFRQIDTGGDWSQAELDGLQVALAPGTIAKDSYVSISYLYATGIFGNPLHMPKDWVGNNYFINLNGVGSPERMSSYL